MMYRFFGALFIGQGIGIIFGTILSMIDPSLGTIATADLAMFMGSLLFCGGLILRKDT